VPVRRTASLGVAAVEKRLKVLKKKRQQMWAG
jgi:hypothetical protein